MFLLTLKITFLLKYYELFEYYLIMYFKLPNFNAIHINQTITPRFQYSAMNTMMQPNPFWVTNKVHSKNQRIIAHFLLPGYWLKHAVLIIQSATIKKNEIAI